MTRATRYSLWFMPTGDVYSKLAGIISNLSAQYNSPSFQPHVTLLGELLGSEEEIVTKTKQLAGQIKPSTIKLTHIDYLAHYFRCLFLRADETVELMGANDKAKDIFCRQRDLKFTPHLSLMYGDFSPQTKDGIIEEIGKEFNISVEVSSIHLFSTNGEPTAWTKVREFPI